MTLIDKSVLNGNKYGLRVWIALNDITLGFWLMCIHHWYISGSIAILIGLGVLFFIAKKQFLFRMIVAAMNVIMFWLAAFYFIRNAPTLFVGYSSLTHAIVSSWMFFKGEFENKVFGIL